MNGRAFLLLSILLLTALSVACTRNWHPPASGQWPPPTPPPSCPNQTCGVVPFEKVSYGFGSWYPDGNYPHLHIIRDANAWQQFWYNESTRPAIDFSQDMVVAVEDDWPSSSFDLHITQIIADSARLTVEAEWVVPGPGCPVLDVMTAGYHIVRIPWTALPAQLNVTVVSDPCG